VTTITVTRRILTLCTPTHVRLPGLLAEAISRDWQYSSPATAKVIPAALAAADDSGGY
jgi:hypothetical protein